MALPIEFAYIPGRTLYAIDELAGQFWNTMSTARESFNSSNWAQYAITLTEYSGTGIYAATYPASIPTGQLATQVVYQRNGSTPTLPGLPGGDSYLGVMQSQGTNVQTIAGDGTAAVNMAGAADVIIPSGAVASGTITSGSFPTNLTNSHAQAYVGRIIVFKTGACAGQATNILTYNPTNGVLTVAALTTAPTAGDVFVML